MTRPIFRNLVLMVLWLGMTACGGATVSPPPVQPSPTTLTQPLTVLCTSREELCQTLTQTFEAFTGISTQYVRLSAGEALERLRAGQAAPEFDVWYGGSADGYVVARTENLLLAHQSEATALIAKQLKDPDGYWVGAYVGVLGFCSNQDVLTRLGVAVPQSWAALLDPALQGQVAMAHPDISGTAYTALWTQATLSGNNLDDALNYFQQLHVNIAHYTRSGPAPVQMASEEKIAVGIVFFHDCAHAIEAGAPMLTASFPVEGTGYEIGGLAMLRGTANDAGAKMFVDWALSREAQSIPNQLKIYTLPTNPQVAVSNKAPIQAKLVDYDVVAAGAARRVLLELFTQKIAPVPTALPTP